MYSTPTHGPNFGCDYNLYICRDSNTSRSSLSRIGGTYGITSDLIGENKLIEEIEVFTVN